MRVGEGERTSFHSWFSFIFRPGESWHLRGDRSRRGCISQNRRLKWAAMQAGYLVQVLLRHTCDAGICRVGGQRNSGLFEPVAECFGMNAEQASAVCDRKRSHDRVSFRVETKRQTRETTVAGNFLELRHFQEISWKSGRENDGQQLSVGNGEEARISQPSDDVWCGNSWHDFDGSDATTTRPEPDRQMKKRAR